MNLMENISLAIAGLRANKMRAFLTMLGIIIGISSVIMITTLGSVLTNSVNSSFDEMGATNLAQFNLQTREGVHDAVYYDEDFFTTSMIDSVKERFSDDIKYTVLQTNVGKGTIISDRKKYTVDLTGFNEEAVPSQTSLNLLDGRNITESDVKRERNVILITNKLADKLFPNENAIGKQIDINVNNTVQTYSVVGVLEYKLSKLSSAMVGASGEDVSTMAVIPVTTANKLTGNNNNIYYNILFYAKQGTNLTDFSKNICDFMNKTYYKNNRNFEVSSYIPKDQIGMLNNVLNIVSLVISVIAGISLLVGGIGVMNIMLVSVTERTREIGVRKALGAPNSAIRVQFIVESIIICLIGGIIGIIFGIINGNLIGMLIGEIAPPSILAIIVAVTFSMAIGVFFGYYPANKAAKLDPIDALRYE